jgi:four helix bundle protein
MANIRSFKELKVWQRAMDAAVAVFELSRNFPDTERFSLTDQMRRSSRSVPANISEAWRKRRYAAAFVSKLNDAEGEAAETQTHIELARRFGYLKPADAAHLDQEYEETLAMLTDIRYTPTDCFETFAFPQSPPLPAQAEAEHLGEAYHEHRRQTMLARQLGLTKTYNLFHNPQGVDADIARLRELHAAMDRAILAWYGWTDLDPSHGFHQNERGQTRYTISPIARRDLLRRLLALKFEIAARETDQT